MTTSSSLSELLPNQNKILSDLERIPRTEVRHNRIRDRLPDTLEWFLDEEKFKLWRDSPKASILWVNGSPGQGKSVLAKLVTQHLEDLTKDRKEKSTVIYFFCYNQDESFSHALGILRALIIQLIDCQELFEYLPTLYRDDHDQFFRAPLSSLWNLFQTLTLNTRHQHIYCVIDALDECNEDNGQRGDLLLRIVKLISEKQTRLRLLITSRPGEKDIERHLRQLPSLHLQGHSEDLRFFINSEVESLESYMFDHRLKKEIADTLHAQAGRTFLWISIVLKEIASLEPPSLHDVRIVLAELPKSLNQLYSRLVSRLISTDTLAKILIWVAYSQRPLSIDELEDAITYDPSLTPYKCLSEMTKHRKLISQELIHGKLGTLLEVQKKKRNSHGRTLKDYVFSNHQSVRDFFHQDECEPLKTCTFIGDTGPDLYLARTCIWYLNAMEFRHLSSQEGSLFAAKQRGFRKISFEEASLFDVFARNYEKISDRYYFFAYASIIWYKHIKTTEHAVSEWKQIQSLLDSEQPLLKVWLRGHWESRQYIFKKKFKYDDYPLEIRFSDLAVELDISWLTELILSGWAKKESFERSQILNMTQYAPESFHHICVSEKKIPISSNMVQAAAKGPSSKRLIQLLLRHRGSEIKITESVIEAAMENRNVNEDTEFMRLLLDQQGAAGSKITERLLIAAARKGVPMMQLLLEYGGKGIKITENVVTTAACASPSGEVMQLLLDQRSEDFKISEDLLTAATNSPPTMQLLLEYRGKEFKITERVFMSAVNRYKDENDENVMQLLLEQRSEDFKVTEPTLVAMAKRGPSTLRLLLRYRAADIKITEAVMRAVIVHPRGEELFQILSNGRDAVSWMTASILMFAIERGTNTRWVQLLLKHQGIQIMITQEIAKAAARHLHYSHEMRPILRIEGAEVNTPECLMKAAAKNEYCGEEIMQLLLKEWGAGTMITEGTLIVAASNLKQGKGLIALLLNQESADIQITKGVLKEAARNPFHGKEIMELLLKHRRPEINILQEVAKAAAMTWAESLEISQLLEECLREGSERIGPVLYVDGSNGVYVNDSKGYRVNLEEKEGGPWVHKGCLLWKTREMCLEMVKLLMQLADEDCRIREELLRDAIGDNSVSLMLALLVKSSSIATPDFPELGLYLKEQGFTSKVLALGAGGGTIAVEIFQRFCAVDSDYPETIKRTLYKAAANENGGEELCAHLLEWSGIDNIPENLVTVAARSGQVKLLDLLLQKFRLPISTTTTAEMYNIAKLYNAAQEHDEETVIQLLTERVPPGVANIYGHTPLWKAAVRGHTRIVQLLLETENANVESTDQWNRTVLFWAAAIEKVDIVTMLLDRGANQDHKDVNGQSPLQFARRWDAQWSVETIENFNQIISETNHLLDPP